MRITFLLALLCTSLHSVAQRVTSVTAEQRGQELVIYYHLEADGPVEVQLYLSTDRGSRWEGPLKSCSGDVGPNVAPGTGKRIRWEVLKDRELVGDGIAFKVVAKGGMKKEWLNPSLSYGSVTDIDGNTYATIQIGKQVWMAENLRTSRYGNGDPIPNVTDDWEWTRLTSGAWASYRNDIRYDVPHGKLYNWYVVNDTRKVCPTGWHVPSEREWQVLIEHLGGEIASGDKLKSVGTLYWPSSSTTNISGFSGLPSGRRLDTEGYFSYYSSNGNWWSATALGSANAWYYYLDNSNLGINRNSPNKRLGFSVRCLMDR